MSQQKTESIRLLLVDDHEVVRLGLRTLFERTNTIKVVGDVNTAAAAVAAAARLKPDVVLMDVRLPDGSGVEASREILAACSNVRVLFLTSFSDDDAVLATVCGGASGYLLKEIGGEALVNAIKTVAEGRTILAPGITRPVIERLQALTAHGGGEKQECLALQEQRVLALVAEGKTNKEIAANLDLSDKTVKNYLSHIFQKLQITRRSQAAAYFVKRSQQ